jgi:ParE toxin of type II toxin-antitoxin system, parDE
LNSTIRDLYGKVREFKQFPYLGKEGRKRGTRELVFTRLPFIAVYRVKNETIEVLRIWHGARRTANRLHLICLAFLKKESHVNRKALRHRAAFYHLTALR